MVAIHRTLDKDACRKRCKTCLRYTSNWLQRIHDKSDKSALHTHLSIDSAYNSTNNLQCSPLPHPHSHHELLNSLARASTRFHRRIALITVFMRHCAAGKVRAEAQPGALLRCIPEILFQPEKQGTSILPLSPFPQLFHHPAH